MTFFQGICQALECSDCVWKLPRQSLRIQSATGELFVGLLNIWVWIQGFKIAVGCKLHVMYLGTYWQFLFPHCKLRQGIGEIVFTWTILLLNGTLFSFIGELRSSSWFTQDAPISKSNMLWIVHSDWLKHPCNYIVHTLYCLKTAGNNYGLHKTAHKIRHIF